MPVYIAHLYVQNLFIQLFVEPCNLYGKHKETSGKCKPNLQLFDQKSEVGV